MDDDDLVLWVLPTSAAFWLSDDQLERSYFLAGSADGERVQRYTKVTDDGDVVDYWLGLPVVSGVQQLCTMAYQNQRNMWIVIDDQRLNNEKTFDIPMIRVLKGATKELHHGTNKTYVLKVRLYEYWGPKSMSECAASIDSLSPNWDRP